MGNPTTGTLEISTGLHFEHCNPSFIWSEDSQYLAVPQYSYSRIWGFGKQRLLVIDVTNNLKWQSKKIANYIQPISFKRDEIAIEVNPFKNPTTMKYKINEIKETFEASPALPDKRMPTDRSTR